MIFTLSVFQAVLPCLFILAAIEVHKGCLSKSGINFFILPQVVIIDSFKKKKKVDMTS